MSGSISREDLKTLYVTKKYSMNKIHELTGISVGKIHKLIHEYKIQPREQHKGFLGKTHIKEYCQEISKRNRERIVSDDTRRKISESNKCGGIGHKKKRSDGYIAIYFPDHPLSNSDGYIMEHQLVMECLIGRRLNANECVHHINFIRDDNRKENLKLMTISEHMSLHSSLRHQNRRTNNE